MFAFTLSFAREAGEKARGETDRDGEVRVGVWTALLQVQRGEPEGSAAGTAEMAAGESHPLGPSALVGSPAQPLWQTMQVSVGN